MNAVPERWDELRCWSAAVNGRAGASGMNAVLEGFG